MESLLKPVIKDFKFVPLMFVPLGSGSQMPLLRAIFHDLGTQTQGYKTQGYKGKLLDVRIYAEAGVELKTWLGVRWPAEMYEKVTKPKKDDLTKVEARAMRRQRRDSQGLPKGPRTQIIGF